MEYTLTENLQLEALNTLADWVKILSVLEEASTDAPFGQPINQMLQLALNSCEKLGMRTFADPEGYYGYAEVGQGEDILAVLCHVDVVPAGDLKQWKFPPNEMTLHNGFLYGRGTQDDKGPTVAALYALKAVLESSTPLNKRVRFIFGTDEETLWRCMEKYNQKEEKATIGFAPDADFPLIYAEKGLLQAYILGPKTKDLRIQTDSALNVVPDKLNIEHIKVKQLAQALDKLGYDYQMDAQQLTVLGESVHAKDAPEGINAITRFSQAAADLFNEPILNFITKELAEDPRGQQLFGPINDEMSGPLTINAAQLMMNKEESKLGIDLRLPVTADKEAVITRLKETLSKYDLTYQEYDYLPALYVPQDHPLVETLLNVYRDLTGDLTPPMSSGGATYARTMENCVAFGARTKDSPMTEHQANERMNVKNFYEAMEIYAQAIQELACEK